MFNVALPKSPSISPGASISLQQGQHGGSSAAQSRDRVSHSAVIRRTVGALLQMGL